MDLRMSTDMKKAAGSLPPPFVVWVSRPYGRAVKLAVLPIEAAVTVRF